MIIDDDLGILIMYIDDTKYNPQTYTTSKQLSIETLTAAVSFFFFVLNNHKHHNV